MPMRHEPFRYWAQQGRLSLISHLLVQYALTVWSANRLFESTMEPRLPSAGLGEPRFCLESLGSFGLYLDRTVHEITEPSL